MTARQAIGHDAGAKLEELAVRVGRARKDWLIESKALSRLPPHTARAKVESLIVARRQREAEGFKSELRVLAAMVGAGAKGAKEQRSIGGCSRAFRPASATLANGRRREGAKEMHARTALPNWRKRGGEADDPAHRLRGSGSVGNVTWPNSPFAASSGHFEPKALAEGTLSKPTQRAFAAEAIHRSMETTNDHCRTHFVCF